MKIEVGDRFVRDTRFGRISYTIVDITYCWSIYGNLLETIHYDGEGPTGTCTGGTTWKKDRQHFESIIKRFNARKIPKGEIGIQSYVPRHKFQ